MSETGGGLLVAIEGGDGAGKATAAAAVAERLRAQGRSAAVLSFPRYRETVSGHVIGEILAGRIEREVTPRAAAVLYALDRLESRATLLAARAAHDVVVLDRYIASNIAYQAARVPAEERAALIDWILALELDQFALPPADLSVYLDTPPEVARELIARKRARSYTAQTFDAYEADDTLQRAVRETYATLAAGQRGGAWMRVGVVADGALRPPEAIAAEIAGEVVAAIGGAGT